MSLSRHNDIQTKEFEDINLERLCGIENGERNNSYKSEFRFLQYFAAFTVSTIYLLHGTHSGWSGPVLQKLHEPNSSISLTAEQDSLLASSYTFGSIPASILGAIGGIVLGRKLTLLLATIPILCGTLLFATSNNVWLLILGRWLCGVGIGSGTPLIPLYISEITSADIRGRLVSFIMVAYNLGVLLIYAVGPYVSLPINSMILLVITLSYILVFVFMPETPYYSVMTGKPQSALQSLNKLKVTPYNSAKLVEIEAYVKEQQAEKVSYWDIFLVYSNRKALLLSLLLTTTNCLTGINVILAYAQSIFDEIGSNISSNYSSITFAIVGVLTIGLTSFLIDTWGRRPLIILSSATTSVPLFLIGLYFFLKHIEFEYVSRISLLPVISIICVKLTMSIGVTTLPQVTVGEMFPTNIIPIASSFIEFYGNILRFAEIQLYRTVSRNFGTYTVFWIFCVSCVINTVIISICFPETKNKTLEEIQSFLKVKKK